MTVCKVLAFIFFLQSLVGCKDKVVEKKAIKDFRVDIQPKLTAMVAKGISYYSDFEDSSITDNDLRQLSNCEHALIRAASLKEMLNRSSFHQKEVVLTHLDDSAVVLADRGEFGVFQRFVSDELLDQTIWKNKQERDEVADIVLLNYPNLSGAYIIAPKLKPLEKYYPNLRMMVQQERDYTDIEQALYALARYRKKEDIPLIREILWGNRYLFNEMSFHLIQDYPDTSYLEIINNIAWTLLSDRCMIFRKGISPQTVTLEFLKTLASFRSIKSAQTLKRLLERESQFAYSEGGFSFKNVLYFAIYANPCPAYQELLKIVTPYCIDFEKNNLAPIKKGYQTQERPKVWQEGDVCRWWSD